MRRWVSGVPGIWRGESLGEQLGGFQVSGRESGKRRGEQGEQGE